MKKKLLSAILTLVMIFSVAVPSLSVAALNGEAVPLLKYRYVSDRVYGDQQFWYPNLEAYYQFNTTSPIYERDPKTAYTAEEFCYFDSAYGTYVDKDETYRLDVYKVTLKETSTAIGAREYTAFLAGDGLYYPSLDLAKKHTNLAKQKIQRITKKGTGMYFALNTGRFYDTYSAAYAATISRPTYIMIEHGGKYYEYYYTPLYRNSVTGKYYLSYQEAEDANITGTVLYDATPTQGYYFNRTSGRFYFSREDAKRGSTLSDVLAATSLPYTYGIYWNGDENVPYYEEGVYNPNYSSEDNASVKNGDAYIYNNTKQAGWTKILYYVKDRGLGTSVNVNMNKQYIIPKSFIEGFKGTESTVVFINENGSRFSLKGSDITKAQEIDVRMVYGTTNIPASVLSTVRKNALSSSQFFFGKDETLGLFGNITVSFSKERAGKTVHLYYYDTVKGKAVFITSAKVAENGRASFKVNRGGNFVAVIMK